MTDSAVCVWEDAPDWDWQAAGNRRYVSYGPLLGWRVRRAVRKVQRAARTRPERVQRLDSALDSVQKWYEGRVER